MNTIPRHFMKTCILLIALTCSLFANSQVVGLSGKLLDEKNQPIPFGNIALLRSTDNSFISGAITDSAGRWMLALPGTGTYVVRFTSIGFVEQKTEPFTVADQNFSKDFGSVNLKTDAKTLQTVTVEGLRPTITQL